MRTKLSTASIVVGAVLVAAAYITFSKPRPHTAPVALLFQEYGPFDPSAYLWLTNTSTKPYRLTMTGSNLTYAMDYSFGKRRESWLINCAFSDETANGVTNWLQQPALTNGGNAGLLLNPNTGILIRIPLPADGQRRKVAALYEGSNTASAFWATPAGFRVFRMLPPWLRRRVCPQRVLEKAWCEQVLSYPADPWVRRK